MDKIEDTDLLHLFHQCSHRTRANGKFRGQGRLLIRLLEHGTLTQRELIELTGRRSATLSEQLESMEKAGYITRTKNEQDRRNVDVSLTALGREAAAEVKSSRARQAHELFSVLNQEEREQLYHILCRLLSSWENLPPENEEGQK